MKTLLLLVVLALVLGVPRAAWAHGTRSAFAEVVVRSPSQATITLGMQSGAAHFEVDDECTLEPPRGPVMQLRCPRGVAGKSLAVIGLDSRGDAVVVRAHAENGDESTTVLTASAPRMQVPGRGTASSVLSRYTRLGFDHVLGGVDHLLLLLALFWGAVAPRGDVRRSSRPWRGREGRKGGIFLGWDPITLSARDDAIDVDQKNPSVLPPFLSSPTDGSTAPTSGEGDGGVRRIVGSLARTATTFTVAHSLSLAATVLGWFAIPSAAAEAAIALSLVLVALDVGARDGRGTSLGLVAAFGLVHGLGFASGLTEVGLPQGSVVLALLAFNIGVELAQVATLAGCLLLYFAARGLLARRSSSETGLGLAATLSSYAIGVTGAALFFLRTSSFFR